MLEVADGPSRRTTRCFAHGRRFWLHLRKLGKSPGLGWGRECLYRPLPMSRRASENAPLPNPPPPIGRRSARRWGQRLRTGRRSGCPRSGALGNGLHPRWGDPLSFRRVRPRLREVSAPCRPGLSGSIPARRSEAPVPFPAALAGAPSALGTSSAYCYMVSGSSAAHGPSRAGSVH
jgi:hypothetical protein